MKEYVPVKFADYMNIVSHIIRDGKERGVFRPEANPGVLKRALFGALDELVLYWVLNPAPKHQIKDMVEQTTELFVRGLRA
jgi:TetR/AcrR family fatty acid metabolism transcriptional regulator